MKGQYQLLVLLFSFIGFQSFAQEFLEGQVFGRTPEGKVETLVGANLFWKDSNEGGISDENGLFAIKRIKNNNTLIVSFIGYKRLQLVVANGVFTIDSIILESGNMLGEVEIREVIKSTEINAKSAQLEQQITKKELLKAACCNLAESFETNPSIDIAFTDALTGTRQVELLGLSSKYAPLQIEQIPHGRGLNFRGGFSFIPGTWVEGIQLSKGVASVTNGHESMTGLINVELVKPTGDPKSVFNMYVNSAGRSDWNFANSSKVSSKWNQATLLHVNASPFRWDMNGNGFMDMPTGQQFQGLNRWKYEGERYMAQLGVRALHDSRQVGTKDYAFGETNPTNRWGMESSENRFEFFGKNALQLDTEEYSSIGLIVNVSTHNYKGKFGPTRRYQATQNSILGKLIWQYGDEKDIWVFKNGLNYTYDDYNTEFLTMYDQSFVENTVGAFSEATFTPNENFTAVAGLRADRSNLFGVFVSPRLHLRYEFGNENIIRLGGGRGYRTSLALFEGIGGLASNRNLIGNQGFGQEIAWNTNLSYQKNFKLNYRKGSIVADVFYTYFDNQLIQDFDQSPFNYLLSYTGGGSALSTMIQIDYELMRRHDIRLAYKYQEVITPFASGLREAPFISPHRAFINYAYATKSNWKFDLTANWYASRRLPDTQLSLAEFQQPERSPEFFLIHAQINKEFNSKLEMYIGVENLLNLRQPNPIISANDPTNAHFDATLVWGPIFGRMFYYGLNFKF